MSEEESREGCDAAEALGRVLPVMRNRQAWSDCGFRGRGKEWKLKRPDEIPRDG